MAITEESRHHLVSRLEEVLGPEEAFTLIEHLPPVGWADVATKRDLDLLETRLRLEFTQQFGAFRAEFTQELAALRAEFTGQFGAFRDEFHADRRSAQRQLIFVLVVALVGLALTTAGVR